MLETWSLCLVFDRNPGDGKFTLPKEDDMGYPSWSWWCCESCCVCMLLVLARLSRLRCVAVLRRLLAQPTVDQHLAAIATIKGEIVVRHRDDDDDVCII